MIETIFQNYLSKLYLPGIAWNDIIEIIILAYVIYKIMAWIKNTKAWNLLKGIVVIALFILGAYILQLRTILWITQRMLGVGIIAVVILFQPEFRRALEKLGTRRMFLGMRSSEGYERFSKKTAGEIVDAAFDMSIAKTGALIVIEQNLNLDEYIKTGITVDGAITSQLLLNIFEKNTPLHDGAVIIRGDRVVAATCYLPLSNNEFINKSLGTRHRAALGVSEETDSLTIIVSEETGNVSIAAGGELETDLDRNTLMLRLEFIRKNPNGLNPIRGRNTKTSVQE
ncbi:MAG: diadenylate cyclase CdaA [Clostridiales bacterium]|nr:diadenylate cyclase CdaA [Clostridiales bacterium]MDU1042551.1 diadenylate cyclase CdaA [Clostridiales bacterium]